MWRRGWRTTSKGRTRTAAATTTTAATTTIEIHYSVDWIPLPRPAILFIPMCLSIANFNFLLLITLPTSRQRLLF
uniref:Uncharacterized protein n=1 Tax=Arundo donax TaxID=35708 RepID=A0A0A8ZHD9_ARUDO